ncbi:MAG: flavodoxin family protein [Trichlorobacter sp.]|jgi:multimeric flavodoxin WrbA
MNIVAIIGSPHGINGNTGRLLEEVINGASASGAQVELIDLSRMKVQPCVGCDACHKIGSCHLKDDFEGIKDKLLTCDGFILASPNYIFSVSAQLKALFDRCCSLVHCLPLEGKYGAVVETSGGGEDEEVIRYMERFINSIGAQSVGAIGSNMAGSRSFPGEEALFAKARELGAELFRSFREKPHFPDQAGYRASFKTRMKRLVELYQHEWTYEYQYWQQHHADTVQPAPPPAE